jgi:hypothetical protein
MRMRSVRLNGRVSEGVGARRGSKLWKLKHMTGATSGFPLLVSLTAANARSEQEINGQASHTSIAPSESPSTGNPFAQSPLNVPSVASGGLRIGARHTSFSSNARSSSPQGLGGPSQTKKERFFPDRTPRPHQTLNPEASWKVITGVIPPDLMDTLVRCYLSTSHLLWPFLNVPSFLQDYANPQQWGEPGFACFIVAVCTLSSRHVDDPRVRASPQDPSTAGKQYFELFKRLRDLPSAERPTLYSIQAAFLAGIYAFGLGNLSKAFALQAESITLCLDGGLHRSVDGYDHFDAVEKESRKVSGFPPQGSPLTSETANFLVHILLGQAVGRYACPCLAEIYSSYIFQLFLAVRPSFTFATAMSPSLSLLMMRT